MAKSKPTTNVARGIKGFTPVSIEDRLWSRVDKEGPVPFRRPDLGECWVWTGATNYGYGQIWLDGKHWRVARLVWEMVYGHIPPGMGVLHLCDNPPCVRHEHLFLGTPKDNAIDRERKGRNNFQRRPETLPRGDRNGMRRHPESVPRGEAHVKSRLNNAAVVEIRQLNGIVTKAELARKYNVSEGTIRFVQTNQTWRHVHSALAPASQQAAEVRVEMVCSGCGRHAVHLHPQTWTRCGMCGGQPSAVQGGAHE